jgi:hypothetical protein
MIKYDKKNILVLFYKLGGKWRRLVAEACPEIENIIQNHEFLYNLFYVNRQYDQWTYKRQVIEAHLPPRIFYKRIIFKTNDTTYFNHDFNTIIDFYYDYPYPPLELLSPATIIDNIAAASSDTNVELFIYKGSSILYNLGAQFYIYNGKRYFYLMQILSQ